MIFLKRSKKSGINKMKKVRNKKIGDIIETKNYEYYGYPVINGRGFEIKADSRGKIVNFLREYATRDDENKFFEK